MKDSSLTTKPGERVISEPCVVIEVEAGDSIDGAMDAMRDAVIKLLSAEAIVFPCHVAYLAKNGGGYIARFAGDGECTFLAESEKPTDGFALPVHALLMDATGYTSRVILRERPSGA